MKVARVFQEPTGLYHVCDDALDHLDAGGPGHLTKAQALRHALSCGYTHAVGSGVPWQGVRRIPAKYRTGRVDDYYDIPLVECRRCGVSTFAGTERCPACHAELLT